MTLQQEYIAHLEDDAMAAGGSTSLDLSGLPPAAASASQEPVGSRDSRPREAPELANAPSGAPQLVSEPSLSHGLGGSSGNLETLEQ